MPNFFDLNLFCFFQALQTSSVKLSDTQKRANLIEIGKYISESLPKFTQIAQVTSTDELEILIHPEGVIPVLSFLKENHRTQFHGFIDITAVDIPAKPYRFEVKSYLINTFFNFN